MVRCELSRDQAEALIDAVMAWDLTKLPFHMGSALFQLVIGCGICQPADYGDWFLEQMESKAQLELRKLELKK